MNKVWTIIIGVTALVGAYILLVSLYLPINDQLQKADAIVVVSGGDTAGRTRHGIKLYKQEWAPQLVFAGAARDPNSASNARAMLAIATAEGVPAEAITLEEHSRDTRENAQKTKQLLRDYKKIILVTSDYHQRRVDREFQRALGEGVVLINSPAKDKHWGRKSWFLTPYGWWVSLTETTRLVL